jgi:hypothetical protein
VSGADKSGAFAAGLGLDHLPAEAVAVVGVPGLVSPLLLTSCQDVDEAIKAGHLSGQFRAPLFDQFQRMGRPIQIVPAGGAR